MKNSYILLRNNIESSSLELEDLEQIGLLPTDLIWVECQSVAWRKPQEISELKELLSVPATHINSNNVKEQTKQYAEIKESSSSNIENKKHVFVELPKLETLDDKKEIQQQPSESITSKMNKYGNPDKVLTDLPEKKRIEKQLNDDQSFDKITEKYTNKVFKKEKPTNTLFGIELPENIRSIAIYIAIFAAGALLMLLIMNNDLNNKIVLQPNVKQTENPVTPINPPLAEIEQSDLPEPENIEPVEYIPTEDPGIVNEMQKTPSQVKSNTPVKKANEKTDAEIVINNKSDQEAENIKPVSDPKSVKKITVEKIASKIALSANDYNMGSFGGIKNLEITLQNNSAYLLDRVTVQINYLNPEGNTVNADNIYFQSITPGEVTTLPVKKSKRGVKIDYKITKIESKEIAANSSKMEENNYSKN